MTFQETAKIMAVFKAAYPRYYANIDVEEARRVTTLWRLCLPITAMKLFQMLLSIDCIKQVSIRQ